MSYNFVPFPGQRPASVTTDPEIASRGTQVKAETAFPGSRYAATRDPLRDGDLSAPKTQGGPGGNPFGLPFGAAVTADLLRTGNSSQVNNAGEGAEFGESGVVGVLHQGAIDDEHTFSQDGGRSRSYVDPNPTAFRADDAEHVGVAGEGFAPYLPPSVPNDPEH